MILCHSQARSSVYHAGKLKVVAYSAVTINKFTTAPSSFGVYHLRLAQMTWALCDSSTGLSLGGPASVTNRSLSLGHPFNVLVCTDSRKVMLGSLDDGMQSVR